MYPPRFLGKVLGYIGGVVFCVIQDRKKHATSHSIYSAESVTSVFMNV